MKLKSLLGILLLTVSTLVSAVDNLPSGSIGTVDNPTAQQNTQYSFSFTPTTTGSQYIGFAFRQDPAFWNFTNVSLTTGSGSNLLFNGNLAAGGPVAITTTNGPGQVQAPQGWGVWYQNGTYPAAAGSWSAGQWYDGAVGTYDGIYQGISLTSGIRYTVSFYALSTYQAGSTDQARIGVYAGACSSLTMAANACVPLGSGFTPIAVPAQTVNAGTPQANTPVPDPNSAPTVVSTAAGTPIVTNSSANGTAATTNQTTFGNANSVSTDVRGTPTITTDTALARGVVTVAALGVTKTVTTNVYTPVQTTTVTTTPFTTVRTTTTPVTVTTVTTPTTVTTYSDGSTTTTNGTPVQTTAPGTSLVTTQTTTGNQVVTTIADRVDQDTSQAQTQYSTKVDQYAYLEKANQRLNQQLNSDVMDRQEADGYTIRPRSTLYGDENKGWFYMNYDGQRSNTNSNGYNLNGQRLGVGYEKKIANNFLVGAQFNTFSGTLNGSNAGGSLEKQHIGLYSLYVANDWIVKSDLGYAYNTFKNSHSIPELGLGNSGTTNGNDVWLSSRVYTPEWKGVRPFAGARVETNQRGGLTESGSTLTAMSYDGVSQTKASGEAGVRFDKELFDKINLITEAGRTTNGITSYKAGFNYTPGKHVVGGVTIGQQHQDGVTNNVAQASLRVFF